MVDAISTYLLLEDLVNQTICIKRSRNIAQSVVSRLDGHHSRKFLTKLSNIRSEEQMLINLSWMVDGRLSHAVLWLEASSLMVEASLS